MTFVYEPLDEKAAAELKAKISKFQTVMAMTPMRVIDQSRDLVFASLGGRGELAREAGEPPSFYALLWKGLGVAFEGHHKNEYPSGGLKTTVTLTRLILPEHLRDDLPEIQNAIEEAMKTYWATRTKLPLDFAIRFPNPVYR